ESLGGPPTPAIGFAMGIERILLVTGETVETSGPDAFVVVTSPDLRREAAVLLAELRREGLRAEADLRGGSIKSQLRRADKLGSATALILGPSEVEQGLVQLKNLRAGEQEHVARAQAAAHVRAILNREP